MTLRTLPPLPGAVLRHQIINRMGIRQAALAHAMGISPVRINQIINGHAPITPEMALRIGKVTGTEPEYWLALQSEFDLFRTRRRLEGELRILPSLAPE
jgi:addiction module HigA family antidote